MAWVWLAIAIVAEVIATLALKNAEGFTRLWPSLLVIGGYSLAFYLLSLALYEINVGIAYAIWAGVGTALVVLIAWVLHGQRLDAPAIAGIGFIVLGVILINLVSKTSTEAEAVQRASVVAAADRRGDR